MKDPSLREFEKLVLLKVAALTGKAYGVSILEALQEKTGKKFIFSTIHVALKRMEDKGFVKSHFGDKTIDRGGRRKKFYLITAFGKNLLNRQHPSRYTNLHYETLTFGR